MTNLIPVQRPDKNGKLVTRHVKTETGAGKSSHLPAPASVSSTGQVPSERVSYAEYEEGVSVIRSRVDITKDIKLNLSSFALHDPEGFREVIQEFTEASDYKATLWGHMLDWPNKDTAAFTRRIRSELHVMSYISELQPDSPPKGMDEPISSRRGKELWEAAKFSLSAHKEKHSLGQYKATAFALWAERFLNADDRIDLYKEIDNITYIAQNLEAVMEHRHLIRERGSIDKSFIETVLSSEVSALTEGVL
jgi:hypothetical protein